MGGFLLGFMMDLTVLMQLIFFYQIYTLMFRKSSKVYYGMIIVSLIHLLHHQLFQFIVVVVLLRVAVTVVEVVSVAQILKLMTFLREKLMLKVVLNRIVIVLKEERIRRKLILKGQPRNGKRIKGDGSVSGIEKELSLIGG